MKKHNRFNSQKFSVVIPTYKRNNELLECIISIFKQDPLPTQLIVIDDDSLVDEINEKIGRECNIAGIEFLYYKKNHAIENRGSSTSRNIGMCLAKEEIVYILDDDLVLGDGFFARIMQTWETHASKLTIGVGCVISNSRKISSFEAMYRALFLLQSRIHWDVTDVGFQVWDDGILTTEKGYYAHGGACSYRKRAVQELGGFSEMNLGRAALEDVEFALRAKQNGYHYFLVPHAKAHHKHSQAGRVSTFREGWQASQNRKIIFYERCLRDVRHLCWFVWSATGWVLRQFLSGHFARGLGMLVGYFQTIV